MIKKFKLFFISIASVFCLITLGFSSWVIVGENQSINIAINSADVFSDFVQFNGISITPFNNIGFIHENEEVINRFGTISIRYVVDLEVCMNKNIINNTTSNINLRSKLTYGSRCTTNVNIFTDKVFSNGNYVCETRTADNTIIGNIVNNNFVTIVSSDLKEAYVVNNMPINFEEGVVSKFLVVKVNFMIDFSLFTSFNDSIYLPLTKDEMIFNAEVYLS